MELRQLQYFRAVAKTEHYTLAASELSISQPALSRSIAALEKELGVELFTHDGRRVHLNRFGEALLRHVDRIFAELASATDELSELGGVTHGVVRLGFQHTQGARTVPDLIRGFRKRNPSVRFELVQNSFSALVGLLKGGDVDLMIGPRVRFARATWKELFTEEIVLLVPERHRIAGRTSVRLRDLADDPFCLMKRGYGLRDLSDALFERAGIVPHIAFEGEEVVTLAGLVAAGLGIAIVPRDAVESMKNVARVSIDDPNSYRTIGIAWIPSRYSSAATREFRQYVLSAF